MDHFDRILRSPTGRILRICVGLAITATGWIGVTGVPGALIMLAGLVPVSTAVFNISLIGILLGFLPGTP